jgi:hypothetical protein
VDIPDLTAMSFLVLGETRRWNRSVILGEDAANYVIQGFAVEPAAVPDTTIRVRLDPSGAGTPPFGQALGGENLGGTTVRHGQLIGDHDDAANLEGNATQTFDFTAQPDNTYRLQMRFVFADGTNDNRAFWNPSTNAEFIAAVDTRHLPNYELGIAVSPASLGAEYIPLADVAWVSPGPITVSEITDVRTFVFEGAAPFQGATQDAAGAFGDFDRTTTRATTGVNAVYPVLRALGRQIQDIKGEDVGGDWDWFSRVFPAPGGGTLPAGAVSTKSMRSLDTVDFIVGDGTTVWGDFNGTTGLDALFAYINANSATLPRRIRILIRSHETALNTPAFTISDANRLLGGGKNIEIIGQGNGTAAGQIVIDASAVTTGYVFTGESLVLQNLAMTTSVGAGGGVAFTGTDTEGTVIRNCLLRGDTAVGATRAVIHVSGEGLVIDSCHFFGRAAITAPATTVRGGFIFNTQFEDTLLQLSAFVGGNTADHLTFQDCKFIGRDAPFTSQPATLAMADSNNIRCHQCDFFFHPDTDAVVIEGGTDHYFDGCRFVPTGTVTHGVNLGINLTDGTGWGVHLLGASARTHIVRCAMIGHDQCVDAGFVRSEGAGDVYVVDCIVEQSGPTSTALAEFIGVQLDATTTNAIIRGCIFHEWESAGTDNVFGVTTDSPRTQIISCLFDGRDEVAGALTPANNALGVIVSAQQVRIAQCDFRFWRDGTASANDALQIGADECTVIGCHFEDNGGDAVDLTTASNHCVISGCTFVSTATNNLAISADGSNHAIVGNTFNFTGALRSCVLIDEAASTFFTFTGNVGTSGITRADNTPALGTTAGYNETPDFNAAFSYV